MGSVPFYFESSVRSNVKRAEWDLNKERSVEIYAAATQSNPALNKICIKIQTSN